MNRVTFPGKIFIFLFVFCSSYQLFSQAAPWQQRVNYVMEIDFDVKNHRFNGTQKLEYWNNSPDTLSKVFYHLYYNAFQPGSMMDIRSRTIKDPDSRVMDRILYLKENEIGYHKIKSLRRDGKPVKFSIDETILEVYLDKPLLPKTKTTFEMEFESQVPAQIRRTGRNNKEGIAYSMTQWYPKLAEYDQDGWHSNPYVGREFHGVWGDFDVKITIDSTFVLGGTGYLQNPQEIGHGYNTENPVKRPNTPRLTWHFKAPQVHDFAWAADPDFRHDVAEVPNGPKLHFLYEPDTLAANWKKLQPLMTKAFQIMSHHFGKYPYKQYSIIQGGDGGMEYPMATLITAHSSFAALLDVSLHESCHSWFQGILATNESLYPWMDEGFATYGQKVVLDSLMGYNRLTTHSYSYAKYFEMVKAGSQEPITTHSDFYTENGVYKTSSYNKGAIFLHQLSYIIGKENLRRGMLRYFNEWKFKHPTPTDLKRVMEKTSGIELDWYLEQWVETTNFIDYGIKALESDGANTTITLEKVGKMPMPVDLYVYYKDGSREIYYIPMQLMRGGKKEFNQAATELEAWPWAYPEYSFKISRKLSEVNYMEIDSSLRMADVERNNNVYPKPDSYKFFGDRKME